MVRHWQYMSEDDGLSGALVLIDGIGPRTIVQLTAAPGGHCIDTGRLIAALLTKHEDATRGFSGERSGKSLADND